MRAGRTRAGQNAIHAAVMADPALARYRNVERWPGSLRGFEDLAFLFSSNQHNHGIASLGFDEAALLYGLARDLGAATLVEIGRFKGGGTLVLAAGMDPEARLHSYDLHVALRPDMPGPELDRELLAALERYGLAERVALVVADSKRAEPPSEHCDLVFVDGDHTYAGTRADFEHWRRFVRPGGHLLFHDAVDTGGFGTHYPGVVALVEELEREAGDDFARAAGAGSIAHFVRRS